MTVSKAYIDGLKAARATVDEVVQGYFDQGGAKYAYAVEEARDRLDLLIEKAFREAAQQDIDVS